MKSVFATLEIIFLCIFIPFARFQSNESAAWPPDPDTLFAPGIEVSVIEVADTAPAVRWQFKTDSQTQNVHLWNDKSRQFSTPLPSDVNWQHIYESPSGTHLLIDGYRGSTVSVYSYAVAEDRLIALGSISTFGIMLGPYIRRWVSETKVIYQADYTHTTGSLFGVDLTQTNSLEDGPQISVLATERENPLRYEYVGTHYVLSRRADLTTHIDCFMEILDAVRWQHSRYTLGYDCGGIYSPTADHYFYVIYDADPFAPSTLNVLDVRTGEQSVIFQGEIELLESVSPDGRYAVIVTDDNGQVDRAGLDPQFFSWADTHHPQMSLLDLTTGEIVYQIPYANLAWNVDWLHEDVWHDTQWNGLLRSEFVWLNEERGIFWRENLAGDGFEHMFIEFQDNAVRTTPLGEVALILSDRQLLVWSDRQKISNAVHLYDGETGAMQPIIRASDYTFSLSLTEDREPAVRIFKEGAGWVDYRLHLPQTG